MVGAALKLSMKFEIAPTVLILKGVKHQEDRKDNFRDVRCGIYRESRVALKGLHDYLSGEESERKAFRKVSTQRVVLYHVG